MPGSNTQLSISTNQITKYKRKMLIESETTITECMIPVIIE